MEVAGWHTRRFPIVFDLQDDCSLYPEIAYAWEELASVQITYNNNDIASRLMSSPRITLSSSAASVSGALAFGGGCSKHYYGVIKHP